MYYAPSTAGSACFTAAALIEFKHNAHVAWSDPPLHLRLSSPCLSPAYSLCAHCPCGLRQFDAGLLAVLLLPYAATYSSTGTAWHPAR